MLQSKITFQEAGTLSLQQLLELIVQDFSDGYLFP